MEGGAVVGKRNGKLERKKILHFSHIYSSGQRLCVCVRAHVCVWGSTGHAVKYFKIVSFVTSHTILTCSLGVKRINILVLTKFNTGTKTSTTTRTTQRQI